MSLTDVIAEELYAIEPNKTCCRKALLCGLLYSCVYSEERGSYTASFYRERDALRTAGIIDASFPSGAPTEVTRYARGGHKAYMIPFSSRSLSSVFSSLESGTKVNISAAVGFRCRDCEGHFLRGVFASCATLGQPKSGYHLEILTSSVSRANALADLLTEASFEPGRIKRGDRWGLYYKSNVKIADLLYCFGAVKSSFDMTNVSIERDIRNNENRATNCVTSNISRSVGASHRHVEAIRHLKEIGCFEKLPPELALTAELRVENPAASLAELAMLHTPPITKSGLNGRLSRIIEFTKEQDEKRDV